MRERRPEREQRRHKLLSRYRGNGLLGATGEYTLWAGTGDAAMRTSLRDELVATGAIVPVAVEGLKGPRFVVGDEVPLLDAAEAEVAAGRPMDGAGAAFLAPLDPLAWDRDLLLRLWGFDYRWEVYVPAAKRRWGYYVLPLLYGDRFVGRIEPRIDRKTGTLRILGLWWEDGFEPAVSREPGLPGCVHGGDPGAHGLRGPREAGDAQGHPAPRAHGGGPGQALRPGFSSAGARSGATSHASGGQPPWWVRPIIPAATVLFDGLVDEDERSRLPVLDVGVHEQRLRDPQLHPADLVERAAPSPSRRGAAC